MKQAILITAYKNYHHLKEIINFFDDNFDLYIHIDKKSKISSDVLNDLRDFDRVKLITRKFKVNWGGFNHLRSILYLTKKALKNPNYSYLHLISGHDFPIKDKAYFLEFFSTTDEEFINYFDVPRPGWANNGGMDRIEYYNFYDLLNGKNPKQNGWIKRLIRLQKRLGFKRKITSKIPKIYGGSTWWSLSRDCASYVVNYSKTNKDVLNRFKHTLCSEEFYFQTIILNSSFASKVNKHNLRYIDWVARNGNNPAILDETDFEKIANTNAVFARKFEYPKSVALLNKVKEELT